MSPGARTSTPRLRGIALALCLAVPCMQAVGHAHAPAEDRPAAAASQPPSHAPESTGTGTFTSRLVQVEDDTIARIYALSQADRSAPLADAEASMRLALEAASARSLPPDSRASIATGEWAGQWQFPSPDGGLPTRAWRDIDRSGDHGYDAERIGYCRGDAAACAAWFEAGHHRAPEPQTIQRDGAAHTEWRNRVMTERCVRAPEFQPSTAPLRSAVERSGVGPTRIEVGVVLNPCGEVRGAWLVTSSRNRDIDRAALRWARRAIMPSAVDGTAGRGVTGTLPIDVASGPDVPSNAETQAPPPPTE